MRGMTAVAISGYLIASPPVALVQDVSGMWFTPEDFGAVGDDGEDDSDAFDELAKVLERDATVLIPARRYHLSRTWRLPYVQGGRIMGAGGLAHHDIKLSSPLRGAAAEIAWIGEASGTMVEVPGTNLVWDAVSL